MTYSSRREFLTLSTLAALSAAAAAAQPAAGASAAAADEPTPGAPPAFGTAPQSGPEVTAADFASAEKIVNFPLTAGEREQAAGNWRISLASYYERRVGPRKVEIPTSVAPYSQWNPVLPGQSINPSKQSFAFSTPPLTPLPKSEAAIAFAPLWRLARWIQSRKLSSERLTKIYLERLRRYDRQLRCVITLTEELALQQARQADREIAEGYYRGPLHGIPWGAKDLLDTAGIATTYGAEPFRHVCVEVDLDGHCSLRNFSTNGGSVDF